MKSSSQSVLILNPVSGGGNKSERLAAIQNAAEKLGYKGKIILTTKTLTAEKIAKQEVKKGVKHIVVCGGDGTIFEVVDAIVNKKIKLGIVPLGTGNLFARNLHIPLSIQESLKIALGNKTFVIDVGRANGTYFTVIAGIGIDAHIMNQTKGNFKKKFGYFAYAITALKTFSYKNKMYKIKIDDHDAKTYSAKSILVANMAELQGGLKIVPHAHPKSGSLKIGVIKAQNIIHFLDLFLNSAAKKIHNSSHYELFTCNKVVIEVMNGKVPYECDGTTFDPVNKLQVEVFPKSLIVATP